MGRGRQKAKQTKVARELKYHNHDTDLSALAAELSGSQSEVDPTEVEPDYSQWVEDDEEGDDEESDD